VAYAENFRGGESFVTMCDVQINFRRSAEGTTIIGESGGMAPGKFCKITPKSTRFYAFCQQVLV